MLILPRQRVVLTLQNAHLQGPELALFTTELIHHPPSLQKLDISEYLKTSPQIPFCCLLPTSE